MMETKSLRHNLQLLNTSTGYSSHSGAHFRSRQTAAHNNTTYLAVADLSYQAELHAFKVQTGEQMAYLHGELATLKALYTDAMQLINIVARI